MGNETEQHDDSGYEKGSLTLAGSVGLGTGVMIGAGIFALTGQVAEMGGRWFPLAFLAAAVVVAFSAYSYVKVTREHPSAGGIAMILKKAYGPGVVTAGNALLMYFSMVINESLVARTFGTYTMRIFGEDAGGAWAVPALAAGLIVVAYGVNLLGTNWIDKAGKITAVIKIIGVGVFAGIGVWVAGFGFETFSQSAGYDSGHQPVVGFLGAVALSILAFKGFTTITNSGGELQNPEKNVGRSIIISIAICTGLYLLVTLAVGMNLTVPEIVSARDSALAEAAGPAIGVWGERLTIALAILATVTGIIASMFAVSRMLAMLSDMDLVPFKRLGFGGRTQKHTLTYTAIFALLMAIFLDLSRIAALGAIFYIWMDITIHWGVLRHLRKELGASRWVLITAIVLDVVVLAAFVWVKGTDDPIVLIAAGAGFLLIFGAEWLYLRNKSEDSSDTDE